MVVNDKTMEKEVKEIEGEGNIKIRLKRDMTGGEEDYFEGKSKKIRKYRLN